MTMSPPLELMVLSIAVYYAGPFVWGWICGKFRLFGLLLLLLPPIILIAIWPGLLHPAALPFFVTYGLTASIGYVVEFFWHRRNKR